MSYCIARVDKIKTNADFIRKYDHNYRKKNVPNAIPALQDQNEELVKLTDKNGDACDYLTAYKEKIQGLEYYKNRKVRKDNVRGLEIYTSFTRESKDQIDLDEWKKANVKWMKEYFNKNPELYGENVISVMFHGDECGNVHCHGIVIPIDEQGKLSADKYLGGRAEMRAFQDSYSKAMEQFGLERGLKGSSARHKDITKFYAQLNEKMEIPAPEKDESVKDYHDRILELVQTERAGSLRKVLEMDRELRKKRDIARQQDMETAQSAIQAMKDASDAEIRKKQNKLQELNKTIQEAEQTIGDKNKVLNKTNAEIEEVKEKAKEFHEKMGKLEDIKAELDEYRLQKSALSYLREDGYNKLADDIENGLETAISIYEKQMER